MGHIELARWADAVVIAPATANLIARLAAGLADDLLTTMCLATDAPLFIAPAMNTKMWEHAATQRNVARLRADGTTVLGPACGEQACGEVGPGRMLEAADIAAAVWNAIATPPVLAGVNVLVNAGPHPRVHRSGALHQQPQFRPPRVRARRSRARRWGERDAGGRAGAAAHTRRR